MQYNRHDQQLQQFIERMGNLESQLNDMQIDIMEDTINEWEFRKAKERFVIFKNVPDSNDNFECLHYILNLLESGNDQLNLDNVKVFRLGKFESNQLRPRLLKVEFENAADAQWIIRNNKSLDLPNEIVCTSDKTPIQRNMIKAAVIQLKSRERLGEKNLTIKYYHNKPKVVVNPHLGEVSGHQLNSQINNNSKKSFQKQTPKSKKIQ